jgi:hypothetical protein
MEPLLSFPSFCQTHAPNFPFLVKNHLATPAGVYLEGWMLPPTGCTWVSALKVPVHPHMLFPSSLSVSPPVSQFSRDFTVREMN